MIRRRPSSLGYAGLCKAIRQVHQTCQAKAAAAVNQALTMRNWLVGAYIVEYEQRGSDRAEYGERLLERLAEDLGRELGRGFGVRMIRDMRRFYLAYPRRWVSIRQSVIAELPDGRARALLPLPTRIRQSPIAESGDHPPEFYVELLRRVTWTHILEFLRCDDALKRAFYEIETVKNMWSVRELKRQMDSMLFERVGLSKDKEGLLKLTKQGQLISAPSELFKDPYVLEFTGLAEQPHYVESDLEKALLDHLQAFLLELGQGFCFEARQKRVTIGGDHDYIDLVFYHRLLRCHVLIDLKTRKFRPADAGHMNFYLNYYREEVMPQGDNLPVGLILCTDRERVHVEYATAGLDNQVFVSRYLLALPSVKQLEGFLREEGERFLSQKDSLARRRKGK
ncbi:MAG: DUF1016 domain-containing protein [Planctomycetes bacterium]|nr:DUF1016 domain-containing protein [Planctomycetota bacterium]